MANSTSADISADIRARRAVRLATPDVPRTGFLVFDTESVPDGALIARVKYPGDTLSPEAAVEKARAEARAGSPNGSDFLPVTFQVPVAVCVVKVGTDFTLQGLKLLDEPHFRTPEIVRQFWRGVNHYSGARLVTFNGRGFDLPLMELAAYDHGCSARGYFSNTRNRFHGTHTDLMDWLCNYGAYRMTGGLNMLARRAAGGRQPGCGKMDVAGDQVYEMWREGRLQEINDYCLYDTLDTYFVFLRTRVLLGEFSAEVEEGLARRARLWLAGKLDDYPKLAGYLDEWDRTRPA